MMVKLWSGLLWVPKLLLIAVGPNVITGLAVDSKVVIVVGAIVLPSETSVAETFWNERSLRSI